MPADTPTSEDLRRLSEAGPALAMRIVADALGCFWNASIEAALGSEDPTALAIAGTLSQGFAAVASRLEERASEIGSLVPASERDEAMARAEKAERERDDLRDALIEIRDAWNARARFSDEDGVQVLKDIAREALK